MCNRLTILLYINLQIPPNLSLFVMQISYFLLVPTVFELSSEFILLHLNALTQRSHVALRMQEEVECYIKLAGGRCFGPDAVLFLFDMSNRQNKTRSVQS